MKKPGLAPGSLVFSGERHVERVQFHHIEYDPGTLVERELASVEESLPLLEKGTTSWLNIIGLHDTEVVRILGERLDIHPLVLEDILNLGQRPKVEEHGHFLFLVLNMVDFDGEAGLGVEQLSLILGSGYLISFQEKPGDVFEPIRNRIRGGQGRIRGGGADYLAYALVDAIVDHYFVLLEKIGEAVWDVEEDLTDSPSPADLHRIHRLKRDMTFLRKSIWPMRDVVSGLERSESKLIRKSTHPFLRDVYDHTIQVIETVESTRDILSGLADLYLSLVSNRMNEVMKVLTIMATIFIPLTFIAGVYGMNFRTMPELSWRWGYPAVLLLMAALGAGMFVAFKKKKWL